MLRRILYLIGGLVVTLGIMALIFELNNGFKLFHLHSAYVRQNVDYKRGLVDYRPDGPYFNYGDWVSYDAPNIRMTAEGLPQVAYADGFFLNAVTLAEFGLMTHGHHLNGTAGRDDVIRVAHALAAMQSEDGAFRYLFRWRHYLNDDAYEPGWVSGMAQGQSLSLFSRAFRLSGDESLIDAGNRALGFLATPTASGGPMGTLADINPDWARHPYFEEYVLQPQAYTLNGFIYALVGLYDWSSLPEGSLEPEARARAGDLFQAGVKSLELLIDLYDPGGFTVYDLGYITHEAKPHYSAKYHGTHIYQVDSLARLTNNAKLAQAVMRWKSYVDPNQSLLHRVATWRYK